jgi:hypothetical protein
VSLIAGNLQSLIAKPALVSRARRLASIGLAPAIFAVLLVGSGFVMHVQNHRREVAGREHPEMLQLASEVVVYGAMLDGPGPLRHFPKPKDAPTETANALATLIAGRHHELIADPEFARKTRDFLDDDERALAQRALREHPWVSADELERAQTMTGYFFTGHDYLHQSIPLFVVGALAASLICIAFVNFVSVVFFGTSLGLRLFGFAVVNQAGEPAGRLRLLWRSCAAWAPFLLLILIGNSDGEWSTGMTVQCIALLLCTLTGLIAAIRQPFRGPHDRLAGTRLVPR